MFTHIAEVLQGIMGIYVYIHRGGFAGNYGSMCLHPSRRSCRKLCEHMFTPIEDVLQGIMGLYVHSHRGGFAGNYGIIHLPPSRSFSREPREHMLTSIEEPLHGTMGVSFYIDWGAFARCGSICSHVSDNMPLSESSILIFHTEKCTIYCFSKLEDANKVVKVVLCRK